MSDYYEIQNARPEDSREVLALYKSCLYGPADWDEHYPCRETLAFDLSRNALFVMKNEEGQLVAAASVDRDEGVDALPCWSRAFQPSLEISRVCVRKDLQNRGLARKIIRYMVNVIKDRGCQSVHMLVRTGHTAALQCYAHLGFRKVGECIYAGREFWCLELVWPETAVSRSPK